MENYLECGQNPEQNEITIDILNNDCLRKILSYLTLEEALSASKVCQRWQDCQPWHRFTTLNLIELNLSNESTRHLLSLCGSHLRHVTARATANFDIVSILNENCENLESLSLVVSKCSNTSLSTLLSRNRNLKCFNISLSLEINSDLPFSTKIQLNF